MRVIELDARKWNGVIDFYNDLLQALGAPDWHGRNLNALIDSMVWGGINAVEPPYVVRVIGFDGVDAATRQELIWLAEALTAARAEHIERDGTDVEVVLQLAVH